MTDNNQINNLDLNKIPQIHNREEARKYAKVLRGTGKSKEEIGKIIDITKKITAMRSQADGLKGLPKFKDYLIEGDKVKLNCEKIRSHPDYEKSDSAYKEFVENNENTIFTVEYDKKFGNKPSIVTLKEDGSKQKWLWSDVCLLVLDERDGEFKELYTIEEDE